VVYYLVLSGQTQNSLLQLKLALYTVPRPSAFQCKRAWGIRRHPCWCSHMTPADHISRWPCSGGRRCCCHCSDPGQCSRSGAANNHDDTSTTCMFTSDGALLASHMALPLWHFPCRHTLWQQHRSGLVVHVCIPYNNYLLSIMPLTPNVRDICT